MTTMDSTLNGARPAWGRNFLARPLPLALMFGSFFFITLPLVALEEANAFEGWRISPTFVYVAFLGMSHFLVTFPVYLNKANHEHFTSSWFNRFMYFGVPVLMALVIAVVYGKRGWEREGGAFGIFAFWVFFGLRSLDKYHVLRQSFGVFELTKSQVKLSYPLSMKNVARGFFMAMFLLQIHTFQNGKVFTLDNLSAGLCVVAGVLFLVLFGSLTKRLIEASPEDRSYAFIPIAYLFAQSICAALVVYKSMFYLASLALHYVEYHVLMQPRIFANLSEEHWGDQLLAWLKRHQSLFYVLLAGMSVFIYMGPKVANDFEHPIAGAGWIFWLFVVQTIIGNLHFYVDALLWRFGNPYYRKTLGPLYFKS